MVNEGTMKPRREIWLDAARGIVMLLVLLGHNDPPFIRLIFGFHMPFFFILSGYLYKDERTEQSFATEIKKGAKRYLLPYCIYGAFNIVLQLILIMLVTGDQRIEWERIPGYVKGLLLVLPDQMPACGPMWFLPSIALSMIVFYLIRKIPGQWIRGALFLIAAAVASVLFADGTHTLPFALHTICIALVFLETGYLLRKSSALERVETVTFFQNHRFLVLLPVLGCVLAGYVAIRLNPIETWVDLYKARLGSFPLMFAGALLVSFALILFLYFTQGSFGMIYKPFAFIGTQTVFLLAFDEASNFWGGGAATARSADLAVVRFLRDKRRSADRCAFDLL